MSVSVAFKPDAFSRFVKFSPVHLWMRYTCNSNLSLIIRYALIGSSEGGNKSEDEGDYDDDDTQEKNGFDSVINEDENIVNGHNLPTTEAPFPWNIALGNNNKQKQQSQDDKVTAQPPQLLLTSGHLTTGCLQAAQLLIPTARGNKNKCRDCELSLLDIIRYRRAMCSRDRAVPVYDV